MTTDNLKHWKDLSKTDPKYTKTFSRAGGFKGTAQNPTYAIRKMTEKFGPVGTGWGLGKPEFTVHTVEGGQVLVYCTVPLWYEDNGYTSREVYGVGGDSIVVKQSSGLRADDEAFKKAYTDAMTNAMKFLGVGADLHLGMYDDVKYINELKEKFSDKPEIVGFSDEEYIGLCSELNSNKTIGEHEETKKKARSGWSRMIKDQQDGIMIVIKSAEGRLK